MKRLFALVIGMVLLSACSSSELTENPPNKESNLSEFVQDKDMEEESVCLKLDSLNQAMFPTTNQTRGLSFRKLFDRVKFVIVSDAVGAMFGALIGSVPGAAAGAAIASGAAIGVAIQADADISTIQPQQSIQMNDEEIALSQFLLPTSTESDIICPEDSIGYNHNLILLSMDGVEPCEFNNLENIIDKVAEIASFNYNIPKSTILLQIDNNNLHYHNISNTLTNVIKDNQTLDSYFSNLIVIYPEQASKLKILHKFFDGLFNIEVQDNKGDYLMQALAIIDQSALDTDTKLDMRNAFIVGNASNQLWTIK